MGKIINDTVQDYLPITAHNDVFYFSYTTANWHFSLELPRNQKVFYPESLSSGAKLRDCYKELILETPSIKAK